METPTVKARIAWQPLTPRGVAAFAGARLGRLLWIQLLFALAAAGTVVWFLGTDWFPTISQAISRMPPEGQIRAGVLDWQGDSPVALAEGHFLAVVVDLEHQGGFRSPAHLQLEFGRYDCRVLSLLGFVAKPYAKRWVVAFGRTDLEPWWGAWRPALLGIAAVAVVAALMVTWGLLATLYALPVYGAALFANRDLGLAASWRLAGAALMPGALFLTLAILVYGLGALDLVHLGFAAAAHLVIGWVYLVAATASVPRHPAVPPAPANPFAEGPPPPDEPGPTSPQA